VRVKTGRSANNKGLGVLLIIVSIIMVLCTIAQAVVAVFAIRPNVNRIEAENLIMREFIGSMEINTRNAEAALRSSQSIQITAGVNNKEGSFVRRVDAKPGEEVLVQISYRNMSESHMEIIARVALPKHLELKPGSTVVYNRTNPSGNPIDDGIVNEGISLGGYNAYDGEGRGEGSVSFIVRVTKNLDLFVSGVNTLNIVCQIAGFIDGVVSTDTYVAYTAVDVIID
jgi:hypothetical protein